MATRTRMTKVKLSELVQEDPEARQRLENLFMNLQGFQKIYVEKRRFEQLAQCGAEVAKAQMIQAFMSMLTFAGEYSNMVATEANWLPPFRDAEGQIVLESPFTMRDQRVAARAMHSQMSKQAAESGGDDDLDNIFEDDDENRH